MKILQIINSHALSDGGAQRLALELHRAYRARGHDAHLLSIMPSPTTESGTYSLHFTSPYKSAVLPRLIRFLRQKRWADVDVIHVHLFPAQLWVALALAKVRLRAAIVTTEHNTFNRRRATLLGRWIDSFTLRAYGRIICVSGATRDALAMWQPQTSGKLVTIANGIDLHRFSPSSVPKAASKTPIILAVGRISPQKNYATALRAIAQVPNHNFRFQIAGQDEMNGKMQLLARELGLENRVEFLGYQGDIPALLSEADIFLMCSHWEGLSLAVAEAMATGLPVIVPAVPGMSEVVGTDGESAGFLVDPDSSRQIQENLTRLLQDADLRQKLGIKARSRSAHFDINKTIESHLHLFEQLRAASPLARA